MRGWLWLLVIASVCSSLVGCLDKDDCELYHTCPGDLIELAADKLEADAQEACRACLVDQCRNEDKACAEDWGCNLSTRCRLTTSPLDYQDCIQQLYRQGYTRGGEKRKPWETEIESPFDACRRAKCAPQCLPDPFSCNVSLGAFKTASVTLAVRKFDSEGESFVVANEVEARACYSDGCEKRYHPANERGQIPINLSADRPAESLYFEIKTPDNAGIAPDFPPTLYYPRMMGLSGPLLASVYLVRNRALRNGNQSLGFGARVLEDAAQSLILPDGCTWEDVSVADLRLRVTRLGAEKPVAQCHALPACGPLCNQPECSKSCVDECVWYSGWTAPGRVYSHTDGSGGGAVALREGEYEIEALRGDEEHEEVVSRRTVRMRAGWMTVVRTWPVPKGAR